SDYGPGSSSGPGIGKWLKEWFGPKQPPAAAPAPPPPASINLAPYANKAPGSYAFAYPVVTSPENTETYPKAADNPVKVTREEPVSTFSADVDTASYGNVRRYLDRGALPPKDAVRVEELLNYFDYAYQGPKDATAPFASNVALYQTPWNKDTRILHIGIRGYDIAQEKRPKAN